MGLLDDAIREHLELKRRRGADPDEVAREESDALGPPRRGEFATPEEPSGEAPGPAVGAVAAEPASVEPLDQLEPPPAPPPALGGDAEPEEDPWLDEPDQIPPTEILEHPEDPEREPRGDDVLEETPDFLSETPEHDRLWFEQRPPRDFDFDR